MSLLLVGALPALWPETLALAVVGAVLTARLPSRLRRSRAYAGEMGGLFTGRRTVRVGVLYVVALILFAGGVGLALAATLDVLSDRPLVVNTSSGEHIVIDEGR